MSTDWRQYFHGRGTADVTQGMAAAWKAGAPLQEVIEWGNRINALKAAGKFTREAAYREAISVHQGAKSKRGQLANSLTAFAYEHLFAPWGVKVEQKVAYGGKRDIDLLVELPKGDVYVSVTTVPRERKDKTWPAEYEGVLGYRKVYGEKKPFGFIALMYEGTHNATRQQNERALKIKEALMQGTGVIVACAMLPDQHEHVLSRIMGKFI